MDATCGCLHVQNGVVRVILRREAAGAGGRAIAFVQSAIQLRCKEGPTFDASLLDIEADEGAGDVDMDGASESGLHISAPSAGGDFRSAQPQTPFVVGDTPSFKARPYPGKENKTPYGWYQAKPMSIKKPQPAARMEGASSFTDRRGQVAPKALVLEDEPMEGTESSLPSLHTRPTSDHSRSHGEMGDRKHTPRRPESGKGVSPQAASGHRNISPRTKFIVPSKVEGKTSSYQHSGWRMHSPSNGQIPGF